MGLNAVLLPTHYGNNAVVLEQQSTIAAFHNVDSHKIAHSVPTSRASLHVKY